MQQLHESLKSCGIHQQYNLNGSSNVPRLHSSKRPGSLVFLLLCSWHCILAVSGKSVERKRMPCCPILFLFIPPLSPTFPILLTFLIPLYHFNLSPFYFPSLPSPSFPCPVLAPSRFSYPWLQSDPFLSFYTKVLGRAVSLLQWNFSPQKLMIFVFSGGLR